MADSAVRNNSPDPTKYHSNIGGMPGTMIPRAGREGQSLAFDPNKPQIVVVDPGEEGGGFSLDMSQLGKSKVNFNSAAVREEVAQDPSSFFRGLSKAAADELQQASRQAEPVSSTPTPIKEPVAMLHPRLPETLKALPPIQPLPTHKLPDEAVMEKRASTIDMSAEIVRMVEEEKKQHISPERNVIQTQPSRELAELRQHMTGQGEAINALIGAVNRMLEKPVEPPVVEAPKPVTKEEEQAPEKTEPTWGISSLDIEFLVDGKPQRPMYETYFEMSKMGTMSARYHAVIVGKDCLALVYDTRFADGFQYLPPNLGEEEILVSVPKMDNATYTCSSLGLHWTMGCLDVVILIKLNKETEV